MSDLVLVQFFCNNCNEPIEKAFDCPYMPLGRKVFKKTEEGECACRTWTERELIELVMIFNEGLI